MKALDSDAARSDTEGSMTYTIKTTDKNMSGAQISKSYEKPQFPHSIGKMLHVDIFSTNKKYFLMCVEKFLKFAMVQPIPSHTIEDVKLPLIQLVPQAKQIYCDNEPSLNSDTTRVV